MPIIETEIWKKNPERPGTVIFDSQRIAQEVFTELKSHLESDGRLPDEYFLFDERNWGKSALFPKDAEILCYVDYGGSEGIYIDIFVKYQKEIPEYNKATGTVEHKTRTATEKFATGKTLGESIEDLDKMNLVASSVTAAFNGNKAEVKARYAAIESGREARVYPCPLTATKKKSITERLAEASADAREYNAQRAQAPATTTKKHKKESDIS